jgi:hypothetical protein
MGPKSKQELHWHDLFVLNTMKTILLLALLACAGCDLTGTGYDAKAVKEANAPTYNYVLWPIDFDGHSYIYVQGHGSGGLIHSESCTNHCQ